MDTFQTTVLSAIIALATSLIVAYFAQLLKTRAEQEQETRTINRKYLNPLRLYLEETHFRLNEIKERIEGGGGKLNLLLGVPANAISAQSAAWFNGEGCYLISSCYYVACLFYQIYKVREDFAYLRLGHQTDTYLLNLMFRVSHAFLEHIGIFYATQSSIGLDMYLTAKNRLLSYRELCEKLQETDQRVWFDRLVNFFIETGQGQHLERVTEALRAMAELSAFLDKVVGGDPSIQRRYQADGRSV